MIGVAIAIIVIVVVVVVVVIDGITGRIAGNDSLVSGDLTLAAPGSVGAALFALEFQTHSRARKVSETSDGIVDVRVSPSSAPLARSLSLNLLFSLVPRPPPPPSCIVAPSDALSVSVSYLERFIPDSCASHSRSLFPSSSFSPSPPPFFYQLEETTNLPITIGQLFPEYSQLIHVRNTLV